MLSSSLAWAVPLSNPLVIKLSGSIPVKDAVITIYDEAGQPMIGSAGEMSFEFNSRDSQELSQNLYVRYSGNIPQTVVYEISFAMSTLEMDASNKIATELSLTSSDKANVTIDGSKMKVQFPQGNKKDYELAIIKVTVRKDNTNMLAYGEYQGSMTISYKKV